MRKTYYTYILKCADGSYYVGITSNLEDRVNQHNTSEIESSYTHYRRPVQLVYFEESDNPYNAIEREKQLKGWSHKKKEALINHDQAELKVLAKKKFS